MALVRDLMTTDPITVIDHAAVDVAIELMLVNDVSALAVVDREGGLVGVISEYDVLELHNRPLKSPKHGESCAQFMTSQVKTISKDASLKVAADIFRAASIRRLFVVDGNRPVGILSRRDIVREIRDRRCRQYDNDQIAAS